MTDPATIPDRLLAGAPTLLERELGGIRCFRCKGRATLYRRKHGNGVMIFARCERCGMAAIEGRPFLSPKQFTPEELAAMPWDKYQTRGRCYVCARDGYVESHHLAPVELFGAEAGSWPLVAVCKDCHDRWHRLMNERRKGGE